MLSPLLRLLTRWWFALLLWMLATSVLVVDTVLHGGQLRWPGKLALAALAFALGSLLAAASARLRQRRWGTGLLHLLLACGAGVSSLLAYAFVTALGFAEGGDHFADHLTIPPNLRLHQPVDLPVDLSLAERDSVRRQYGRQHHGPVPDFQLYHSSQPGLYEYDAWTTRLDSGTLYLRASEITHQTPLSASQLPIYSALGVCNPTDRPVVSRLTTPFTIYEGDWHQPYAARFELWFAPAAGGPHRRLLSKNYEIEGWQR